MTTGLSTGMSLVQELGEVSRAAAVTGVKVVAPIAANTSLTFKFGAQAAGTYTLEVRYSGESLVLQADGSPSITPGPADSTTTLLLPISAGSHAITASDLGQGKVVVDWELFLNNGIGQAVAPAAAPASPIPVTSGSISAPAVPMSGFDAPTTSATTTSPIPMVGMAGPSLPLSPVSPIPNALVYQGDGVPEGAIEVPSSIRTESTIASSDPTTPGMAVDLFKGARSDAEALLLPGWIDRFVRLQGSPSTERQPEPVAVEEPGTVVASVTEDPSTSEPRDQQVAADTPAMVAGVGIALAIGRRWRQSVKTGTSRRPLVWSASRS